MTFGSEQNGSGRRIHTMAGPVLLAVDGPTACAAPIPRGGAPLFRSHIQEDHMHRLTPWAYTLGFVLLCGLVGAIGGPGS